MDEFHHAAAPIYRRLLQHFRPRLLLGLTATPERTDQSDIPSLCDDNLVYTKILFLQQLGRGLRRHAGKRHLVVLDSIGNHKGLLNKPQALFDCGSPYQHLAAFGLRVRDGQLKLPPGCFANYDLAILDCLTRLGGKGLETDYRALEESGGRRPTLTEVRQPQEPTPPGRPLVGPGARPGRPGTCRGRLPGATWGLLREVETTVMVRSFKAILLESFLDLDGFATPPRVADRAELAPHVLRRRRRLINDIRQDLRDLERIDPAEWLAYWSKNPIDAWTGCNRKAQPKPWFEVRDGRFAPTFAVADDERAVFQAMVQESVDYRLAAYEPRLGLSPEAEAPVETPAEPGEVAAQTAKVIPFRRAAERLAGGPLFSGPAHRLRPLPRRQRRGRGHLAPGTGAWTRGATSSPGPSATP